MTAVILCDDVRKEITGKDILIGVYSGTINVPAYPVVVPASLWIELEPDAAGTILFRVRMESPSGNPPVEINTNIEVIEKSTAVFVVTGVPLSLERDGEIVVSVAVGSEPMRTVKRKKVQRAPFMQAGVQPRAN
ncbi:MAG: hypothetical protein E5X53_28280 [Mesorhizobium sp.]|uniref:DUF6941 family protein n=1 Tax=Mesorhizobium sp. TaxID=1871066 RepID=UPI001201A2C3|nr:hypothetical protein [Mesorhizobium sp.]TIP70339.1 MAG: hypothetical protein E5X55_27870 [Mesorhizobium sp.]TIQ06736.1 MAG: hypothetical protein E5X57_24090 [Mesorhizobium sp.]TIR48623.1 MAG: hypothetical protein E5X53_28280 [Mesorhizobium sp.]TJV94688.1 MAG: hypothetical protein E5X52_27855 [Mesorhizobium sp.]